MTGLSKTPPPNRPAPSPLPPRQPSPSGPRPQPTHPAPSGPPKVSYRERVLFACANNAVLAGLIVFVLGMPS